VFFIKNFETKSSGVVLGSLSVDSKYFYISTNIMVFAIAKQLGHVKKIRLDSIQSVNILKSQFLFYKREMISICTQDNERVVLHTNKNKELHKLLLEICSATYTDFEKKNP
jgi:hypothetical protein